VVRQALTSRSGVSGQHPARGGAIHAPVLRHRRRSRRRRFLGPLGIGVVAFLGIGVIVLSNGAAPLSTAGAVADETHRPTTTERASVRPTATAEVIAAVQTPGASETPGLTEDEDDDTPLIEDLTGYRWPISNPRLTLPFGATPWGGWVVDGEKFHDGIDLATFCGDRIRAAHSGTVVAAGRDYDDLMGWRGDLTAYRARLDAKGLWPSLPIVLVIDDGNGYRSIYAHFRRVVVGVGDAVAAGDLIGYEGATGRASGCHLHYGLFSPDEVRTFGLEPVAAKHMLLPAELTARVDPLRVLPPLDAAGIH
jgi:murein DD-endopeptidase MepM/ murein hydrolase activator NlpD